MLNGRKVITVTPCYAPAAMFDASRAIIPWSGVVDERWVLLNKYPLPSVEENEAALAEAATRYGYQTFDSGDDLGLQGSLNNFLAHNPQPPGTILITVDPDSACVTPGWDAALAEVMCAGGYPMVACGIPELASQQTIRVAGRRVFVHPSIQMFNVCAFDLAFIARCGGFSQPVKYWGGLEGSLYEGLKRERTHIAYLPDFPNIDYSIRDSHDPRYAVWKWEHFYGRFDGSFADYLRR
jgi:hypothetical protein